MFFNNSKNRRLVIIAAIAFSIVLAVLRIFIVNIHAVTDVADPSYYYVDAKGTALAFAITVAVICALCAAFGYIIAKYTGNCSNRLPLSTALLSGCMMVSVLICSAAYCIGDGFSVFTVLLIISALLSALGFAMMARKAFVFKSVAYAITTLSTTAFYLIRVLYDFVKQTAAPLDCSGGYHFISLLAVMLFFMHEARSAAKIPQRPLYFTFGLIAIITLPVFIVPTVSLYFIRGFGSVPQVIMSVCDLAAYGYIISRLWLGFGSGNITK